MASRFLSARLEWCALGERALLNRLRDTEFELRGPSRLDGWTRAHVLSHLIGNAQAMLNLLQWAETGERNPMYPSPAARNEQIERDAHKDKEWLIGTVAEFSDRVGSAMVALPAERWSASIENAQGQPITAELVPWMRSRESFIHLVDLDIGCQFADTPLDFLAALIDDVSTALTTKADCPALRLRATDGQRSWTLGSAPEREISASTAELAAWITGRTARAEWPSLPRWL